MTSEAPAKARRPLKSTRVGVVRSDKRDKTRTVAVPFQYRHPKYGKIMQRHTRLQVHDPENASHEGDRVEIARCRPFSKTKSWRLVRIVELAPQNRPGGAVEDVTRQPVSEVIEQPASEAGEAADAETTDQA